MNSAAVLVFDSVANSWFSGPTLSTARNASAVALGDDGFLYVMGGDYPAASNNALDTVEKIDTGSSIAPQIISFEPFAASLQVASTFSYKVIALGNPRPVLSLAAAPAGMTLDAVTGLIAWTPAANQTGTTTVTVRATNSAGIGEQTFAITVTPIPSDTIQPTAPASIALTARTATSVTLTWPAGSDNVGVVSYNIYGLIRRTGRGGGSFISLAQSGITGRSYIAPGSYSAYYVAAVDAAGNVSLLSPSVAAGVLTLPVITRTNPSESTTVIVGNSLLLSLTATANPGPPIFSTFTGPAGLTVAHHRPESAARLRRRAMAADRRGCRRADFHRLRDEPEHHRRQRDFYRDCAAKRHRHREAHRRRADHRERGFLRPLHAHLDARGR